MYAVFYFVDLYFTIVDEYGSSKAGLNLLYYLPGLGGMFTQPLSPIHIADHPQVVLT